jgi:hypothetical protein
MRFSLLALAGGLLLSGAAQAAEPNLIDHWSQPVVERLLQSLRATDIQQTTLAGEPGLLARTADGLSIGVYAKACVAQAAPAEPYCRGVEGLASFDPGRGADRAAIADRLNHQYAAGKFTVEADGSIRLTRYIDLDAGVSEANLRSQLGGFLALADAAKDAVWAAPAR